MKMKRRDFLGAAAAGAAGTAVAATTGGLGRKKRPNIIYMVVHDLGRHFSPYGVPIDTPNLQAFADGGIVLENASCAAPPCGPSRACCMTGEYAHTNGVTGLLNHGSLWSLSTNRKTIVDYLNAAGYETAWAGFQHERDHFEDNHYQINLPHRKTKENTDVFIENAVDDAIGYLESRRDSSRPFYLNIGTQEVHESMWGPHAFYTKRFDRPHNLYGIDPLDEVHVPAHCPDNRKSREMFARFVPCIRYMDSQFGRLVAAVDRLGLRENTLFVFTTDHGVVASRAKSTVYERGMEIGTIIQMPGVIKPGDRMKELVNNIDILPTLLEMAGAAGSSEVQGRSFWPRLCGDKYTPTKAIFTERNWHENYDPVRTVRTDRYHYILNLHPHAKRHLLPAEILSHPNPVLRESWPNHRVAFGDFDQPDNPYFRFFGQRPREELYDLQNDPEEFVNLAADPAHSKIKTELAALCDDWMRTTKDPILDGPIPGTDRIRQVVAGRMNRAATLSADQLGNLRD